MLTEQALAVTGGLAGALLVLLITRTVLAERRAGVGSGAGPAEPRRVRRSRPVLVLDGVAVLVLLVLLAVLAGRIAVALRAV